jgi:hypothetical protein
MRDFINKRERALPKTSHRRTVFSLNQIVRRLRICWIREKATGRWSKNAVTGSREVECKKENEGYISLDVLIDVMR